LGLKPWVSSMLQMRFLELPMNTMLFAALMTACVVNMACLLVHL
jgi:hypothetical protein